MTALLPSLSVLLIFACLVAYNYIKELQRQRDNLKEYSEKLWRLYEKQSDELRELKGLPAHTEHMFSQPPTPAKSSGFRPAGIGPTAINARETIREREQALDNEPPFTREALGVTPSRSDIADAAREAMNGNRRSN